MAGPGQWNQAVVGLDAGGVRWSPAGFAANLVADVRGYGPAVTEPKMVLKVDGVALPPGVATVSGDGGGIAEDDHREPSDAGHSRLDGFADQRQSLAGG